MKRLQYLVRWTGYSQAHDSWEDADDVFAPDLVRAYYDRKRTAIREQIFKQPDACNESPVSSRATNSSCPLSSQLSMSDVEPTSPWSLPGSPHPAHDEFSVPVPGILTGPTIDPATFAIGTGVAYCDDILLLDRQQEPVATWSGGMWAPFCTL